MSGHGSKPFRAKTGSDSSTVKLSATGVNGHGSSEITLKLYGFIFWSSMLMSLNTINSETNNKIINSVLKFTASNGFSCLVLIMYGHEVNF